MAKKSNFQGKIENHLITFKEEKQYLPATNCKKKWQYYDISDNLFPPTKHSFLQLAYDDAIIFHDYVNHVRSSQVFGFNLLYPILKDDDTALIKALNLRINFHVDKIIEYHFEYSYSPELLGEEIPPEHVTTADLMLLVKNDKQEKSVIILEVKFTEEEFSECTGYSSRGNNVNIKKYCDNWDLLSASNNSHECYLHTYHPKKSPRKYFDFFQSCLKSDFPNYSDIICPFLENHQCLRNHAMTRALKDKLDITSCYFGLIYHDDNVSIRKYWDKYYNMVSNDLRKELFEIKASELLNQTNLKVLKQYFNDRYTL